jgi:hypothetical protein
MLINSYLLAVIYQYFYIVRDTVLLGASIVLCNVISEPVLRLFSLSVTYEDRITGRVQENVNQTETDIS